jgi:hypothetical protein
LRSADATSSGEVSIPLLGYFGWVESVLLVLLFVASWFFPEPAARASSPDVLPSKIIIRIHSDHEWLEKVALDTTITMPPLNAKATSEAAYQTAMQSTSPGDRERTRSFRGNGPSRSRNA